MRRLLVSAAAVVLMANFSYAEEKTVTPEEAEPVAVMATATPLDEQAAPLDNLPEIEKLDFSIVPDEEKPLILPACDDELLRTLVLEKIAEYHHQHPAIDILTKRRQQLLLKNLQQFEEVPSENFTSQRNYNVANALLMTKINKHLDNKDLHLCKNTGHGNAEDIYLLVYPEYTEIRALILNFVDATSKNDELYVVYPQKDKEEY